jgi:hypothetical protein
MAFSFQSATIGAPNITDVTAIVPGVAALPGLVLEPQYGEVRQGWDAALGSGEFIYLMGVASLAVGDVVSYNALTGATTRWAGTANTGLPLAVAVSAPTATQTGWFQISGAAIINCTGTVAAGDAAFFSATAALKTAAVNGKQVLGAVAASANGATIGGVALASTQAVYTINRPFAQGQIT